MSDYGAYGLIERAKAGLLDGLNKEIETMSVQDGDSFDFGDPIFAKEGAAGVAEVGDTTDDTLIFAGVALISQRSYVEEQGEYVEYTPMNVLSKGRVWVKVPSGLSSISNTPAYVNDDSTDVDYGKFTNETAYYHTGGFFRSEPIAVGSDYLAIVEVRGLYRDSDQT